MTRPTALLAATACAMLIMGATTPLAAQQARVKALATKATAPAYGEALLELAALQRAAKDLPGALKTAQQAATAFDQQVELHKTLSEALPDLAQAQAERGAALALGLRRDEAFWLVAELARAAGQDAVAVRHYVMLVQSQADQPRGRAAYAALQAMGWAGNPAPAPAVSPP